MMHFPDRIGWDAAHAIATGRSESTTIDPYDSYSRCILEVTWIQPCVQRPGIGSLQTGKTPPLNRRTFSGTL
jgi:hypothetical protein